MGILYIDVAGLKDLKDQPNLAYGGPFIESTNRLVHP